MADSSTPSHPLSGETPAGPAPAHAVVAEHAPCIFCGYDLHALAPEGVCPECGRPIAESLRSDRLVFANRAWVLRVALGFDLLFWGVVVGLVCCGFAIYAEDQRMELVFVVAAFLTIGAIMAAIAGIWRLMTDEPHAHESHLAAARWVVLRVCSIFAPFSPLVAAQYRHTLPELAYIPLALTTVLIWPYARAIAARIPHTSTARACRLIMWSTIVLWLLTLLGHSLADLLPGPLRYYGSLRVSLIVALILYAALLVTTMLAGLYSLARIARSLRKAAREALTVHQTPTAPSASPTGGTH